MAGDELDVLLVEDNPGDARLIEEMLREAEELLHRIDLDGSTPERSRLHTAPDLSAAIEHLSDGAADVVLLDLGLPDSTGLDTLLDVLDRVEFTPVVVLTGLDDRDLGVQAIQSGAQDYLVKDEVTGDRLIHSMQRAIDRSSRERERVRHREQLEALNRLNRISQDVTHAVITTSTREELERAVCDRLVDADAYRFAWIGEVDRATGELTPRVSAGAGDGYLEDVTVTVGDEAAARGPGATAVSTREVQVVQDLQSDPAFGPWREAASAHGYRSAAAVPVVHEDVLYGVLGIYAGSSGAFSDPATEVLSRIGDVVGHAITAIERRDALVSDTVLELEFRVEGVAEEVVALAADREGTLALENLVRSDEALLAYGRAEGVPREALREAAAQADEIDEVRLLSAGSEEYEFELLTRAAEPLVTALATHGGHVTSATVADGQFRFVVAFPPGRDKHQLVELVAEHCPRAVPRAQRTTQRRDPGTPDAGSVFRDRLTEKQRTSLEAAVFAGYFDWPRTSTGQEIADRLGITPATFSQHLRAAERKFFETAFASAQGADGAESSPWTPVESEAEPQ